MCSCHGEPCYWQKDRRLKAGGWWVCAVYTRQKNRESHERNRDKRLVRMADRYADITKRVPDQLKKRRRESLARLHRRRGKHGEISPEGRD